MTTKINGYTPATKIADMLNKNISTVYRWLDSGNLEGIRLGSRRYVNNKSLYTYLGEETAKAIELDANLQE